MQIFRSQSDRESGECICYTELCLFFILYSDGNVTKDKKAEMLFDLIEDKDKSGRHKVDD